MKGKEMLAIFKAFFEEGKEVERLISDHGDHWVTLDSDYIYFDFVNQTYRIKPQTAYIPYIWEDRNLFRGKYVRWIGEVKEFMVDIIVPEGVCFENQLFPYQDLFKSLEFIDKTPFGKLQ